MASYNILFKSGVIMENVSDEVAIKATLIPEVIEIRYGSGVAIWTRPEPEVKSATGRVGGTTKTEPRKADKDDMYYTVVAMKKDGGMFYEDFTKKEYALGLATVKAENRKRSKEAGVEPLYQWIKVGHNCEFIWDGEVDL